MTSPNMKERVRGTGFPPGTLKENLTPEQKWNHMLLVESLRGLEPIINKFGAEACGNCDYWYGDMFNTKHSFCPKQKRKTSPHYWCRNWEED